MEPADLAARRPVVAGAPDSEWRWWKGTTIVCENAAVVLVLGGHLGPTRGGATCEKQLDIPAKHETSAAGAFTIHEERGCKVIRKAFNDPARTVHPREISSTTRFCVGTETRKTTPKSTNVMLSRSPA
jgi:hypothetical protein